ncbi:MAG: hypothetical protein AB1333_04530 [Patescibacteria group bacterium]
MADIVTNEMRCYRCILCKKAVIAEGRTKTSPTFENPSDAPDQSNCDLSRTSDYVVTGGRLIKKRPQEEFGKLEEGAWTDSTLIRSKIKKGDVILLSELHKYYREIPFGGVCNDCLKDAENKKTVIPYLEFEEKE